MLAVNVVCAETEKDALHVQAAGELVRRRAAMGQLPHGVPSAADALDQLGGPPEPTRYVRGAWPRSIAAAPARLREVLESMVAEVEADELMIQDLIASPMERLASYRLIAEAFDLRGNHSSRGDAHAA